MQQWIADEVDGVDLGDARLERRYAVLLDRLSGQPSWSIPAACPGRAETQAADRFFDNPKVRPDRLLAPHIAATRRRMAEQAVVLVCQDTTEIDLTKDELRVGGPLSDRARVGLLSHSLLAVTPAGVPLGLLGVRTWARDPATFGTSASTRKGKPVEAKESGVWLDGYRQARAAARAVPGPQVVCVSDSAGDVYECFAEAAAQGHAAAWVVRACQDRRLAGGDAERLFATAAAAPVLGHRAVEVAARRATTGDGRKRRQGRAARSATVTVRATTVTLRPPHRTGAALAPVTVTAVVAREESPPAGTEPVEWLLLTDLPAADFAAAARVIEFYAGRWWIEVYVRILKSGCHIEDLQLETAARVQNGLAAYLVVAWRVLFVTMAGRECPAVPCDAVFDAAEWEAVYAAVTRRAVPDEAPPLAAMVALVARLGGYQGRVNDGPPGPKAIWIGLQQMRTLAWGWETFGPGARPTYA
jgi:hypothetical protein